MKEKIIKPLSLLLSWTEKDTYWLILAAILAMISGLSTMIPYIGVYHLMEAVFESNLTKEVVFQSTIFVAIGIIIRFVLYGCAVISSHKGAYNALFKVRCRVIEHIGKAPMGTLNDRSIGEIKTVINENIEKMETFMAHQIPDLLYYLVGPVVIFCYLLTVNIPLALLSLLPFAIAVMVMAMMFRGAEPLIQKANTSIATLNSVMIEYITGMRLIKAYDLGSKSFKKYSDAIENENTIWNKISKRMGPPYAMYVIILECGMLLMVPFGGMLFLNGSITASIWVLFAFVGALYLTELRPLQELSIELAEVLTGVKKIAEILSIPLYEKTMCEKIEFPIQHSIELKNVSFSYNGTKNVLRDCNLSIKNGEKIAIIGASGSGKSTLIQLIARFYEVSKGEILIGGKNIKEIDYDALLQNISIVFQKTFLTNESICENICMGNNATLEDVRLAAKKAQIDDFIMSLPLKYDTKLSGIGTRLSGGEKQRIAIARAILKNAPILILDEATSSADPENQLELDMAIDNLCKGKTVIIIAHRLGITKSCDKVAVIENQTVSCIGPHEQIKQKNAYYQTAWKNYEQSRNMTYAITGGENYE